MSWTDITLVVLRKFGMGGGEKSKAVQRSRIYSHDVDFHY